MAEHLLEAHELICALCGLSKRMRPKMRIDVDGVSDKFPFTGFSSETTARSHIGRVLRVPVTSVDTIGKLVELGSQMADALMPNGALRPTSAERRAEIEKRAPAVLNRISGSLDGSALSKKRTSALAYLREIGITRVDFDTIPKIYEAAMSIHRGDVSGEVQKKDIDPIEDGLESSEEDS